MKNICGIYIITSPSGKIYIGQSRNIYTRWRDYKNLKRCKNQQKLYNSFLKYGVENHKFEIVLECEKSKLNELEIYFADLYNVYSDNGLNIMPCGNQSGWNHTQEAKIKIKERRKTQIITKESIEKRVKTRKINNKDWHSEETKKKIGKGNKGKTVSLETKQKLHEINIGKSCSEEIKEKISEKTIEGKLKTCKKIIQKDLNGNVIKIWNRIGEVTKELQIKSSGHIYQCCYGKRQSAYGYRWEYAK